MDPDGNFAITTTILAIAYLATYTEYANAPDIGGATFDRNSSEALMHAVAVPTAKVGISLGKNLLNSKSIGQAAKKGLSAPKKYFSSKTKLEIKKKFKKKYGQPKSSRKNADTYYNKKSKRSFNVHEEPGHHGGKPHVDIRRRGGYRERKYDLKEK